MRAYYKVGALFFLLLALVVVSLFRWYGSYQVRENLYVIKEQVEQLKGVDSHLLLAISEARTEINNDEITDVLHAYNKGLESLNTSVLKYHNRLLDTQMSQLNHTVFEQNSMIDNFKRKHAVMKNSIALLIKTSDDIIRGRSNISKNDPLYALLQKTLFEYFRGDLTLTLHTQVSQDKLYKKMLLRHMEVLHKTYNDVRQIEATLAHHTAYKALHIFDTKVNQELLVLQASVQKLFLILFFSSIIFLGGGLVATILQIKAKNIAIKALSDMEQFAKALDASAIVSKTDTRGVITYVNDNFCQLSGYAREELIGEGHSIVRHPDMDSQIFKNLWETIRSKKTFKATLKNRKKDGSVYYVDSVIMPLLGVDGEINEYIGVRYDVTELVNTRDRAVAAQIAKDEFFSNMSHELRTPLNSIIGFSQLLGMRIEDEKQKKQILSILSSGTHLLHLINDILDLSKMESGKFSINKEPFDCDKELAILLNEYEASIQNKNLTLEVEKSDTGKTFIGDWLRISQIISNILGNAIKFTPESGTIYFRAKYDNETLYVEIEDTGIGMGEKTLHRVFQSFEQADNSTTREFGGTGLGLSIVRQLVDLMEGSIRVESTKGKGSHFFISLPLEMVETEIVDEAKETVEVDANLHFSGEVLVAEDNKTNQLLIMMVLEDYDLTCDIANDGVEAVAMCQKKDYDLVLMDEDMPNLSGTDAMKEIHALGIKVPIVALTAKTMIGDEAQFMKAGMDGFIPKPIDSQRLLTVLNKFLKHKET